MKHKVLAFVLIGFLAASSARGQNALVAAGVGSLGLWDTQVELANPFDDPMVVVISEFAFNGIGGCDFGCNTTSVTLPPHGGQTLSIPNGVINPDSTPPIAALAPGHLFTLFIASCASCLGSPTLLPVAHVHAVNRATNAQTEFPVLTMPAILSRSQPTQLTFPGISKSDGEHCNLVLTSINTDFSVSAITATVTLRDPSGKILGSTTVSNQSSDCLFLQEAPYLSRGCANLFIPDVGGQLGGVSLSNGVLDVTQDAGGAALWGQLYCVNSSGSVTTYSGFNP